MVERRLAKANVAGSNPVSRSIYLYAPIAQLDRVTDFESGGRRFESCWAHQTTLQHSYRQGFILSPD